MSDVQVYLDNETVTVFGPPEQIKVTFDQGVPGRRGTLWFVGEGAPSTSNVPNQTSLQTNDLYVNSLDGSVYQYIMLPSNTHEWQFQFRISGGGEGGSGVADHGLLNGLIDDDHPQYLTEARGDNRYNTKIEIAAMIQALAAKNHSHVINDVTGLQTALNDRAALEHTHDASEVTGVVRTINGQAPAADGSITVTTSGGGVTAHNQLTGLGNDDHPQYLTNSRGDARYVAANDARLTDQRIPTDGSVTNAKVATNAGINLDKTIDSATRVAMTPTERTKLSGIDNGATANATNAQLRDRATHTGTQDAATIADLTETVQDIVGSLIVAGSNIIVNYDDATNKFTITSTAGAGGTTDAEIVRDTIAAATVAGSGIQISVDDANDTITISSTAVLPTRQIIAGTGLTGGGDLSANRTLSVAYGTTAGTATQGNDPRLSDARTPTAHTHTASQISDATATGRSLLSATDAAAARTAIGAGTSNLAIGTTATTAKAGNYVPAWSEVTGKPSKVVNAPFYVDWNGSWPTVPDFATEPVVYFRSYHAPAATAPPIRSGATLDQWQKAP